MHLTSEPPTPSVRILGARCARCRTLTARTTTALQTLGIDTPVEMIDDPWLIAEHQVMRIPALVINDQVVLTGRVPKLKTLCTLIERAIRP